MSEKLEYADFLESGVYVEKLEETYNRYLDIRDKKLVEFMEENKRLHSIIKEVREYIEKHIAMFKNGDVLVDMNIDELLEILDKENI